MAVDEQAEFRQEWGGRSYHILSKNCNHFCDAVAKRMDAVGSVNRVPAWINRLAALIASMLMIASAAQRSVDGILKCCSWRRYSHLGDSKVAVTAEGAKSSESLVAQHKEQRQQQRIRARADADAGTFPRTPVKVHVLGDRERELHKLKHSELVRRAKAAGVSEKDKDVALDSNSPKRSIISLIVSAEVAATARTGLSEKQQLVAAMHTGASNTANASDDHVEDSVNESLEVSV